MVLADVFLSTAAALTLLASLDLVEAPSPRRGVLVGLGLAACVLSKIPGLLVFATPALTGALLARRAGTVRSLVLAYAVATPLAILPVGVLLPELGAGEEQGAPSESRRAAPAIVGRNVETMAGWLWAYWTPGRLRRGSRRPRLGHRLPRQGRRASRRLGPRSHRGFRRLVAILVSPLRLLLDDPLSWCSSRSRSRRFIGAGRSRRPPPGAPARRGNGRARALALVWPALRFDRQLLDGSGRRSVPRRRSVPVRRRLDGGIRPDGDGAPLEAGGAAQSGGHPRRRGRRRETRLAAALPPPPRSLDERAAGGARGDRHRRPSGP